MCARNRPNCNTGNTLTSTGVGREGERPGSARERTATGSPRASPRSALRGLFALGTPASAATSSGGFGGRPADVDELVAPLGRPTLAAGIGAAPAAWAEPVADLETEAPRQPRTATAVGVFDVAPAHVGLRVEVLAALDRSRAFTSSPGCLVAGG